MLVIIIHIIYLANKDYVSVFKTVIKYTSTNITSW